MNEKELILEAMNKAGVPLNAGKIAELTGLDRKVVDKTMTAMKKGKGARRRSFRFMPLACILFCGFGVIILS